MPKPEEPKAPAKEEKKGFFSKLKDAAEDKEEQMMILSTFVRLGILSLLLLLHHFTPQ